MLGPRFLLRRLLKAAQLGLFAPRPAVAPETPEVKPETPKPQARTVTRRPVGGGWFPIPGSRKGGYHRQRGDGGYDYWYPGEGITKGHADDVAVVEHATDAPVMAHVVDAKTGAVTDHRGLRFSSPTSRDVGVLHVANDKLGVGSWFKTPDGHTHHVIGRTADKIQIRNADTGAEREEGIYQGRYGEAWDWAKTEQGAAMREARTAHLEAMALRLAADVDEARAVFDASPSRAHLAHLSGVAEDLYATAGGAGWNNEKVAAVFGVSTTLPKSWTAAATMYRELRDEIAQRLPGYTLSLSMSSNGALVGATSRPLLEKLVKFRALHDALGGWTYSNGLGATSFNATAVLDDMVVATPAVAERAIWRAMERYGATKSGRPIIHVGYIGETETERREKLAALRQAPSIRAGRALLIETPGDGLPKGHQEAGQRGTGAIIEALDLAFTEAGGSPCPDIYGDNWTPKPIRAEDLPAVLARVQFMDAERVAAAQPLLAVDPLITGGIKTGGTTKTPLSTLGLDGEGTWDRPDEAQVRVTLEQALRAVSADASAGTDGFRAAHRERVARMRTALDAVKAKVGDVQALAEPALRAWARSEGYDEAAVLAYDAGRRGPTESIDHDWSYGYHLWGVLHPEKRDRIGHRTDGAAARARVHSNATWQATREEQYQRAVARGTKDAKLEGPAEDYDLDHDHGDLGRLLDWIHPDVAPDVDISHHHEYIRAYCAGRNSIKIANREAREKGLACDTLWHEYGHAVEHVNEEATAFANTLRDERAKGDARRRLKDIDGGGYDDHEITYEDKWADKYTGKWYGHQSSTEVLSMGVQHFMDNPIAFHRRDPDHFALVAGVLSGMIGKRRAYKEGYSHPGEKP